MKDTSYNRLESIARTLCCSEHEDLDCYLAGINGNRTAKRDAKFLNDASVLLTKCWRLAHGGTSQCCKGRGDELLRGKETD